MQVLEKLTEEDLKVLRDWIENAEVHGARIAPEYMKANDCLRLEDWKGETQLVTKRNTGFVQVR